MAQLILTTHSGSHDAGAALFEDYRLLDAAQLERLTRYKSDGREHPDLDAFSTIFYKNIRGVRWIREKYRKYVEKRTRRYMPREFLRYNTTDINDIFKVDKFRHASGFRDGTKIFFYNHHEAHALAPLFYSDWNEALLVTADAGGDTVNYSHQHFANDTLKTIYGGEECLLTPLLIAATMKQC